MFIVCVVTLSVSACSNNSEAQRPRITLPDATKSTAPECQIAADASSTITEACQDKLFVSGVRQNKYPELDDVDDQKLVGFARGLCAYASTMAGKDPTDMPLFGDLLASTSNSWGIPVKAVEAIYDASQMLCPEDYAILNKMPRSEDGMQIEYRVTGEGTAKISYTLPHGLVQEEASVDLPWSQVIYTPESMPLSIAVTPLGDSKAGCEIAFGKTVLDEERVAAESANCEVSTKDIDKTVAELGATRKSEAGKGGSGGD